MTTTNHDRIVTSSRIARELGQPQHRITYVLKTRRVEPLGRAGNTKLYSGEAVDQVRGILADIDSRKVSL